MSRDQAPALARRGMRVGGALAGVGDGVDERRADAPSLSQSAAGRHRADPARVDTLTVDREPESWTYTNDGCACAYCASILTRIDTTAGYETTTGHPVTLTQTDSTYTATLFDSIPAADAGSIPDAGSDSPAAVGPDLRERDGQRRRNRDAVRDHHRPGLGDGPGVPRSGRRPDRAVRDDELQRAGHVGYGLQRFSQRRRGDAALLGDGGRYWFSLCDTVRRQWGGRDAGRADLYLVGVERRDGEPLQRFSQRRRGPSDLSGGLMIDRAPGFHRGLVRPAEPNGRPKPLFSTPSEDDAHVLRTRTAAGVAILTPLGGLT